jgi:hypothetical protein
MNIIKKKNTKTNLKISKTDLVSQSDESEDDDYLVFITDSLGIYNHLIEFLLLCSSFLHTSSRGSR